MQIGKPQLLAFTFEKQEIAHENRGFLFLDKLGNLASPALHSHRDSWPGGVLVCGATPSASPGDALPHSGATWLLGHLSRQNLRAAALRHRRGLKRGTLKELTDGQAPEAPAPERSEGRFTDASHLYSPGCSSAHRVVWGGHLLRPSVLQVPTLRASTGHSGTPGRGLLPDRDAAHPLQPAPWGLCGDSSPERAKGSVDGLPVTSPQPPGPDTGGQAWVLGQSPQGLALGHPLSGGPKASLLVTRTSQTPSQTQLQCLAAPQGPQGPWARAACHPDPGFFSCLRLERSPETASAYSVPHRHCFLGQRVGAAGLARGVLGGRGLRWASGGWGQGMVSRIGGSLPLTTLAAAWFPQILFLHFPGGKKQKHSASPSLPEPPSHGTPGFHGARSGNGCCEVCAHVTCGLGCATGVWAENPPPSTIARKHRSERLPPLPFLPCPAVPLLRFTAETLGSAAWDSCARMWPRQVRRSAAGWTAGRTGREEPGKRRSGGNKPVSEDHALHTLPFTPGGQVRQTPTREGRWWLPQAGGAGGKPGRGGGWCRVSFGVMTCSKIDGVGVG